MKSKLQPVSEILSQYREWVDSMLFHEEMRRQMDEFAMYHFGTTDVTVGQLLDACEELTDGENI